MSNQIKVSEVEPGDAVQLRDADGNSAGGVVLVDASRGRLCVHAFGCMLPFASETKAGYRAMPGVTVASHTRSLLREVA